MIKKRMILKQLAHTLDRLSNAMKAISAKDYSLAENDIRTSFNLIKQALEDELKRYRKSDGKNIFKRRSLLQYIKVIKEDLKMIRIDIKHSNIKSACNFIDNIRKILKNIECREENILRNNDRKLSKKISELRG